MSDSTIHVLFVDDEKSILNALQRLLMEEDYEVITANSGEEGLEILREEERIGLIVSDQRMPGLSGAQFLEQAKEMAPEALRIMLTGYADINATIDAINKGGACRYISKPWDDQELVQTIRDAVKQYALVQENKRLTAIVNQQNEELKEWNAKLKSRVLQQTAKIREKNEDLGTKNERLKRNYRDTIGAFSGLIEMRAEEMRNHSRNVAHLARGIAGEMGLPAEEKENIYVASLLHDIGKIGIPDELLGKSRSQMNEAEMGEYRLHAVRGQTAIDAIEDLRPAGVLIRHHHERYDGAGFPDQLRGEEIPLGARVVALADFVDRQVKLEKDSAVGSTLIKAKGHLGSRFDPELFPYLGKPIRELFGTSHAEGNQVEKMLAPSDLRAGMTLGRDLYSGTGLLLLGKGAFLDRKAIESIRRYHQLDPFKGGIAVLVKG